MNIYRAASLRAARHPSDEDYVVAWLRNMDSTSNVVSVSNTDNMDSTSNVVSVSNTDNMDSTSNVVSVSNTDSTSNVVSVSNRDNMDSTSNVVSVSNTDNMDSTSNVVSVSNTDNMDSTSNVVSVSNTDNMDSTSNLVSESNTDNVDSTSNVVSVSNTDNMDSTSNLVSVSNTDNMDSTSNLVSESNTDNVDSTSNVVSVSNADNMDSTSNVVSSSNAENDKAISNFKKSIEIAKETGNKYCEMKGYLDLSITYRETQQYDKAAYQAKECIRIIQEISAEKATEMNDCDSLDVARIYIKDASLGSAAVAAYFALGKSELLSALYEDSLDSFQKCTAIASEIGDERTKVMSCYGIAKLYEAKSQWNDVVEFSRKYIDKMSLFCPKEVEIEAYLRFATALFRTNHYEEAVVYAKKCMETKGDNQDTNFTKMNALPLLGRSYLELNDYDEAINCGKKHLELATATGNKEAEMEAHRLLADTYHRSDQIDSDCNHATKGLAIAEELKNDTAMEMFRSLLSRFYAFVGMHEKASLLDPDMKALLEVPTSLRQELEALVKAVKADDVNQQVIAQFRLYNYHKSMLQYERAINCLKQLMVLQSNCSQEKLFYYAPIGELYIGMKKYKEGLQYCEGGLREVAGCKNKKIRFDFFFYISQLYAANENWQMAERYLHEAIQCFETFYGSLGSNDEFKMSAVDRYNGCFRFLSLVYVQTNRNNEALLVLDKCRARALKDILVDNYGMQENKEVSDITFSDIETLVSSNQFAIFYSSICRFGNALAFLVGYNCFEASVQQVCFDEKKYHQLIDKMFDEIELLQEVNCEDRILDTDQDIKHQEQKGEEEDERGMYCFELRKRNFVVHKKTILMYHNEKCHPGTALELLYCLIIGEGQSLVKQSEIVFIPDGSLCKIPFAALQDPDTGKYLSETKRIRVAPSIATLKLLSENVGDYHSNEGALIIGDPHVGEVMFNGEVTEMSQLKSAQTEAKLVANCLNVKPLIGEEATKPVVLEKLQQGVSVVHIAAHGSLNKGTIALAPCPEIRAKKIPDEEDYMLTIAEVQQAQVRAQLVVLSCCHSGRGEIRAEGVVGMCRAFLASGARAVVASLWAIDDEATLEFMSIFYYNLKTGKSASTSLQETMNEMRNTCSKYKQPKYWAPFFIMGDDITLKFI